MSLGEYDKVCASLGEYDEVGTHHSDQTSNRERRPISNETLID